MNSNRPRNIAISFFGREKDNKGSDKERHEKFRPNMVLGQLSALTLNGIRFDALHLLYESDIPDGDKAKLDLLVDDIRERNPSLQLLPSPIPNLGNSNVWELDRVFDAIRDFINTTLHPSANRDKYFVHLTTGTNVKQTCLFLCVLHRIIPRAELVMTYDTKDGNGRIKSDVCVNQRFGIIRIDLMSERFKQIQRLSMSRMDLTERQSELLMNIDARNAEHRNIIQRIDYVLGQCSDPILLTGPTGAGKTHLVKRIYENKKKQSEQTGEKYGPFVSVNCATLIGQLASSTLFGHLKGAFTGAIKDYDGLLKQANGGMLFLDEIGELPLDTQAMLLKAIEEKEFLPVGGRVGNTSESDVVKSDFQLVCATNKNLHRAVADKTFREDLLARIDLWSFELKGLHDWVEDIEPNIDYTLSECCRKLNRQYATSFSSEARQSFLEWAEKYPWPANFREFSGFIHRLVVLSPNGIIEKKLFEDERDRLAKQTAKPSAEGDINLHDYLDDSKLSKMNLLDRVKAETVIKVCRNAASKKKAGEILTANSDKQQKNFTDLLNKLLESLGLDWDAIRNHRTRQ